MAKLALGIRLLIGLIFVVFGLNGFLHFLPMPPMGEAAGAMMAGLAGSGYFFPLLKGTEVICGALLLANKFVALSLVILSPIVLNIFFFHTVLEPSGAAMAIFLLVGTAFLGWFNIDKYKEILKA